MNRHFTSLIVILSFLSFTSFHHEIGQVIDSYRGIDVYYNGKNYRNVVGRNTTSDGYNLGLKYQCVEYVKRFYYEVYGHKMPNSYGHAKDLFDESLGDAEFNTQRGLMQYRNVRHEKPMEGDILIYGKSKKNPFGHAGIICEVGENHIYLIQQNHGTKTRQKLILAKFQDIYTIADYDIKGWLRYQ